MQKDSAAKPSPEDVREAGRQRGSDHSFAVIVLAAGSTGRQANYRGRSLVEHATRTALASGATEVVVVAGQDHEEVRRRLRKFRVRVVSNPNHSQGLASSIRIGLNRLTSEPAATVISLCDQPKVTPAHLRSLADRVLAENGPSAVASDYDGVIGAPSAFARSMFSHLRELRGRHGARHLIRATDASVEAIHFASANEEVEAPVEFLPLGNLYRELRVAKHFADERFARGPPSHHSLSLAV